MARNILLTSLSAAENNLPLRYFSLQKEFGFDYCDALLDAEAGIKALLSRYAIDEIIVIGGDGSYEESDVLSSVPLLNGRNLYGSDRASLSAYGLLRYRLAQYADEKALDLQTEDELLPADTREKLIRFIQDFHEGNAELKSKKFNRLFDALSQSDQVYEDFWSALFKAFPKLRDQEAACTRWVKNYLYASLKPTAQLELLPVNEKTEIRLFPEDRIEDGEQWVNYMMKMKDSIADNREDINLYVSLSSNDAADTFIVINLLDILVSMPQSRVRLEKLFTPRSTPGRMAGIIRDDTRGFGVSELFHALHSFLDYGKADMIVKIWKDSGEHNDSIAAMVYAMRHVDVGLSMCNIPEMKEGILRLRSLFRDDKFWRESGYYGMIFSVIAESIREDYGPLLEGEGDIPFIELVKWAYRHQFYQQTLTLVESMAPESLVKSGVFYYCNDEKDREQVTELFARQRLELKPYEYYKMDLIDHYFVKTYNRAGVRGQGSKDEDPQRVYAAMRVKSIGNTDPSVISGFTVCDSKETVQNILFAYYHLSYVRNKISHADASAMAESRLMVSESDENSALAWMKDSIDYFIDSYEKAMAEAAGKNPHVVLLTGDEVRKAADRLKYKKTDTRRPQ